MILPSFIVVNVIRSFLGRADSHPVVQTAFEIDSFETIVFESALRVSFDKGFPPPVILVELFESYFREYFDGIDVFAGDVVYYVDSSLLTLLLVDLPIAVYDV